MQENKSGYYSWAQCKCRGICSNLCLIANTTLILSNRPKLPEDDGDLEHSHSNWDYRQHLLTKVLYVFDTDIYHDNIKQMTIGW